MCFLLMLCCAGAPANAITIAEDGQARAVLVIAENAPAPERHAAAELAEFLRQITGADFPLVNQAAPAVRRLLVGVDAAKLAEPAFSIEGIGEEGIIIRTVGDDLILAGGGPRGTLYAVYTFLEDCVGCRWWASQDSTIPKKPTLRFEQLNIRYVPALEYREAFWFDAFDGDWAVRNKCNGHAHRLEEKHGGRHNYEGFVHTFYRLIPPEKYFVDHPEWFSEIDGKRTHENAQLCLTNQQMRAELVKNLKERLRNNPAATIASVSQNDWHGNCQCANCAAVDSEEQSPAGSLLRFVNAVAAEIETDFPRVAIDTLAYQYTRKPPRYVKPRHNVIVRLCSIECSFSKPLTDERNKAFREDIEGWSKIAQRLYVWDYTTDFRHHIMPHPNLRVLGPNVKFFVEHNVKGIFEQGAYTTNGAEMAELRAWVLAKLLWNPALDGQRLIDEFIDGYYGPAGGSIRSYINIMHDAVEQSGDWLGCFSPHTAKFLSFETLRKGWEQLKAAEQAVANEPELRFRVQCAQLPVMYVFIMRWDEMRAQAAASGAAWPMPDSVGQAFEDFMAIARKKNITRLNEWQEGFGALQQAVQAVKQQPSTKADTAGKPALVAEGAKLEKLAGGFKFTEGPAADAAGDVFFSDIPNNRIHRWSATGGLSVFLENSGGANGLFFDKAGNLLACAGSDRRVVCIDPQGKLTVLADKYDNKRLNSPNDLWLDPKGGIYFTDPRYGPRDDLEQDGECVYYLPADRSRLIRVIDDMVRPNGLVGTADGRRLYVADHGAGKTFVYHINTDGTLSEKKLFAAKGSDGMTMDSQGNIYLTTDAVAVYDAQGARIGTIEVPEGPSNVCFGGPDKQTLFVTARTSLYAIRMNVRGL